MKNNKDGFIALISVIIISFVLLSMTITLNFSGFSGRFNIFDSESKERSDQLADACIASARLTLALNNTYTGVNPSIPIGAEFCGYEVLTGKIIKAWATVNKAHTYYAVKVDTDKPDIPICDLQELFTKNDTFILSPCL
jgi:hypothetical protein